MRDSDGRRAVCGGSERLQRDLQWRDYMMFYEYLHIDNGAGVGQTIRPAGLG